MHRSSDANARAFFQFGYAVAILNLPDTQFRTVIPDGDLLTRFRMIDNLFADLDEEDMEELSDEEKITADMMARSGNSVDYTA